MSGSPSSTWLGVVFLFLAFWGLFWIIISIFNPANLADRSFEFGRKHFRVGPTHLGVWFVAKSVNQFRLMVGLIATFLVVIGIIYALVLL